MKELSEGKTNLPETWRILKRVAEAVLPEKHLIIGPQNHSQTYRDIPDNSIEGHLVRAAMYMEGKLDALRDNLAKYRGNPKNYDRYKHLAFVPIGERVGIKGNDILKQFVLNGIEDMWLLLAGQYMIEDAVREEVKKSKFISKFSSYSYTFHDSGMICARALTALYLRATLQELKKDKYGMVSGEFADAYQQHLDEVAKLGPQGSDRLDRYHSMLGIIISYAITTACDPAKVLGESSYGISKHEGGKCLK